MKGTENRTEQRLPLCKPHIKLISTMSTFPVEVKLVFLPNHLPSPYSSH